MGPWACGPDRVVASAGVDGGSARCPPPPARARTKRPPCAMPCVAARTGRGASHNFINSRAHYTVKYSSYVPSPSPGSQQGAGMRSARIIHECSHRSYAAEGDGSHVAQQTLYLRCVTKTPSTRRPQLLPASQAFNTQAAYNTAQTLVHSLLTVGSDPCSCVV